MPFFSQFTSQGFWNDKVNTVMSSPLCFINLRLEEETKASLPTFTLDYFLSILIESRRTIKSIKGIPIKTTQGTNVRVRNNVF